MTQSPGLPFAVVLNPQAGRGLAGREWPRLEAELRSRGLPFERLLAPSAQAARAAVQALPPGQPVLAVGGDGTVGALLPALVASEDGRPGRPLAVVPLGSGNDFAGMLGLRPGDFGAALDRLVVDRLALNPAARGQVARPVDVLDAEIVAGEGAGTRRLLLNGLGLGFDAQVNDAAAQAPARLPGFGRYAWGALASLRRLIQAEVEVIVDGQRLYQGGSGLCAVMNGARYGGGFQISPRSDPRDGLLNVVCSGPLTTPALIGLMGRVLRGTHLGHPLVHAGSGMVADLRWARPMHLHIDGDACGQVSGLRVRVLPGALTLLNG